MHHFGVGILEEEVRFGVPFLVLRSGCHLAEELVRSLLRERLACCLEKLRNSLKVIV